MRKFIIITFITLIFAIPQELVHAEGQAQTPTGKTPVKVILRPKDKPGSILRIPSLGQVAELSFDEGLLHIDSSILTDGMTVAVTDNCGSQWSDFVSPEYPSMPFDGESGEYSIECTTTDGRVYVGEFEL